ncbi:hypothetical protein CFC21_063217 [Triticum aestivum]|uniref:Uncharacterized protein n=2 Tax=Triticum aestivum TaxID=4565 RepID=A0A9R1GZW9_WHEAT|nr:hypothetical protein CFC21_063217 [Triticum aestivum]
MPTPLSSPSPSPPPPPRMTAEEGARLMARVLEDSMHTHDERQWKGLEEMTALFAVGDVAIPELEMVPKEEVVEEPPVAAFHPGLVGQGWSWSCTAEQMAAAVGGVNWCPTPPRSPERDASPREEVVQAPATFHPAAPVHPGPPAHLWTPPDYVDLVSDDDDIGSQ